MLMRYSAWANERLYEALSSLPSETLTTPRPGRPQGMLGVLGHICAVDHIWQGHLQGQPHGLTARKLDPLPGFDTLHRLQRASDAWYVAHTEAQDATTFAHTIDFRFIDGEAGSMRHGDILLHLSNHKTYHRGYIADMLYEAGLKPPTMDLPVFLRDTRN